MVINIGLQVTEQTPINKGDRKVRHQVSIHHHQQQQQQQHLILIQSKPKGSG